MKLDYKRTVFIGLAFMSISAFWQMYDNIIPLILKNSFNLGETLTGMIMAADNVISLFLLPFFGVLSDRITTPFGKRIPFIAAGTILSIISMLFLPFADTSRSLTLFIVFLALTLLSMSLYRSPAVALMPDLTPKPLLSKGNAIINLMGAVGGIIALIMIKLLVGGGNTPNYFPLFFAVALFMALSVIVLILTVSENKLSKQTASENKKTAAEPAKDKTVAAGSVNEPLKPEVKRSLFFILLSVALWFIAYNAVTTAFSRYATVVWGLEGSGYANCLMVATIAAIISYVPIGFLSSHIGRKKTIMAGVILMGCCYFFSSFLGQYHSLINIGFALIGISWAAINVNSLPMVVAIANPEDNGKYTGYYYTFSMSAQIITPILSGFLLEHISYRTLFPYATFFTVLALITMSQVRHGDSRPARKKDLMESFDIED